MQSRVSHGLRESSRNAWWWKRLPRGGAMQACLLVCSDGPQPALRGGWTSIQALATD
jgi:hypothetical protein